MKHNMKQAARTWQSLIRKNKLRLYRPEEQTDDLPIHEGLLPYERFWAVGSPFLHCELDQLTSESAMILLPDDRYLNDPRMQELAQGCAEGDPNAMWDMAEYFEAMHFLEKGDRFFELASNYWRFLSCLAGHPEGKAWILDWAQAHPGERLPALMDESHRTDGLNGRFFLHLGHSFFQSGVFYAVHTTMYGVSVVCEYPHHDGSWDASNYQTTFLDEYLNPLPIGSVYHHPDSKPDLDNLAYCLAQKGLTDNAVMESAKRNADKRAHNPFLRRFC